MIRKAPNVLARKSRGRHALLLCAICVSVSVTVPVTVRAQGPMFVATWQNAWFRAAPSVNAPKVAPVVQGATYEILSRTADAQWLALQSPEVKAWLPAGFGDADALDGVPVMPYTLPAYAINTNTVALPEWIKPGPRARALLRQAVKAGRDPRMFSIVGDSNSTWQRDVGRIAAGMFDLGNYGYLRPVIARFDPAFARVSVAVGGGYRAADMFLPEKALGRNCADSDGMFACELRQSRAAIVFIQLGTGDKFAWREFEVNTRRMIDHALANNVLPVLVTKADDLESIQGGAPFNYINDTIRRLAADYQLPLIDFYAASRTLPTIPNPELPKRPFTQFGLHDEWGYYFHLTEEGRALRVLTTLMMLDAVTRNG
jgi:hypothetical protein